MSGRTSTRTLRRQKHHRVLSDDRISDLPDPILGQILSRIPTQNAVATGILSKRWKLLWTTIGNLDFSFREGSVEQFVQYVNYVMLLHKPAAANFNKLSLTWYTGHIPFYVNAWICTAVTRDVQDLTFRVGKCKIPLHVHSYLLSNEKLKSLELRCSICISPEFVVSLPRLESLDLITVSFPSEEAFCRLLDACPVLKHLAICIDNRNTVAFKCVVSSTYLTHLTLLASAAFSRFLRVELDAPSLEHIDLFQINSIVLQQRLDFLCQATIRLASFGQETRDPNYCNSIVEALHSLSYAQTLDFSPQVIRALSRATIKMETKFNRLTSLTVYIGQNGWSAIRNLIELSDNLEYLSIDKDPDYKDNDEGQFNNPNWTKPDIVPRCLSNSLTEVLICDFDGRHDVLAMIAYIIEQGSVLETMRICFGETFSGLNRKYKMVQLISAFPRKSTICKVKLVDAADLDTSSDSDDDA